MPGNQRGGGGSQDNRISGKIIDATGLPVIGAGVLIQGTTVGTSTDLDGNFSFDLPEDIADPVLEVSCLGYTSQLIPVGVRRVFDITMETDAIMMEATVVTDIVRPDNYELFLHCACTAIRELEHMDEGTYYGSLENYKQVKGIAQGGTGTTTPGTGEDDGDHQLG